SVPETGVLTMSPQQLAVHVRGAREETLPRVEFSDRLRNDDFLAIVVAAIGALNRDLRLGTPGLGLDVRGCGRTRAREVGDDVAAAGSVVFLHPRFGCLRETGEDSPMGEQL